MNNTQRPERLTDLIKRLLDRGYNRAVEPVIRAIVRDSTSGVIAQRLDELNVEAQRLADIGERLRPDNPVIRALLADLETVLKNDQRRIADASVDIQRASIDSANTITKRLALPGVTDEQFRRIVGVSWNSPSEEAVARLIEFVDLPEWQDEIGAMSDTTLATVRNQAVRGIVEGWSPLKTARQIQQTVQSLPAHQANNLMRTLQMQSYRTGQVANMTANDDILDGHMRIAALDDRTCMACIGLHGTVLKTSDRVDDHHQGRCTSIPLVTGRARNIQSGIDWFNELPEERQLKIAGRGKLDALKNGDIRWQDLQQDYSNPAFGRMIRETSLKQALQR